LAGRIHPAGEFEVNFSNPAANHTLRNDVAVAETEFGEHGFPGHAGRTAMKFTFAPEATPLAGYTIKRAIDRGGFGEVYYALSDSGKEVALKLLQRNQQVELRGVRQCLNLKHPNLVTIFDIRSDADEDHWVVMEFVAGKSLEQVLDDYPNGMPLPEIQSWLSGIAAGIGFLHDRGIVHRDLKPANVFRENGVVKIGDVGLSKFITPSRRSAQTESVGTVYYMAPEVARGKYGSELDVYSLGIILFEMLTGKVPFDGESTGEILMKHLTEAPDLSRVAAQFRPVLARALDKDPQKRTPGAMQLAEDFSRAVAGKPPALDIPQSHFVGAAPAGHSGVRIPQEAPRYAVEGQNSHAHTLPYPPGAGAQAGGGPSPGSPTLPVHHTGWNFLKDEVRAKPWLAVSFVILFLFVFPSMAGMGFSGRAPFFRWSGILVPAAICYSVYWFVTNHRQFLARGQYIPPQVARRPNPPPRDNRYHAPADRPVVSPPAVRQVTAPPVAVPVPANPPAAKPASAKNLAAVLTPNTERPLTMRQRMADLTMALTMATFWGLATTGLVGIGASFFPVLGPVEVGLTDPARAALFALGTILGSWAVLFPAKMREGTGAETSGGRLIATSLGAAVGACIWWLSDSLWVEPGFESVFPGLFQKVFNFPLLGTSGQPTLAGFVAFFASFYALRRLWWQADSYRASRFRLRSFAWTGIVAFFVPALFVFPQGWGVCWALAISATTQLSSRWVPLKQRPLPAAENAVAV